MIFDSKIYVSLRLMRKKLISYAWVRQKLTRTLSNGVQLSHADLLRRRYSRLKSYMRKNDDRLRVLENLAILDTAPEMVFDDLTRAMAQTFDVSMAMVNLLDADRDWFKASIGLPVTESPASTSFCEVFLNTDHNMVVAPDTLLDARLASHPLVIGPPHIRFYAAARLQVSGQTVGTLCVYDVCVKQVSRMQIEEFKALSNAAMELLARRISLPT